LGRKYWAGKCLEDLDILVVGRILWYIAMQWLGKHSPGVTFSTTEGHPLLGNGPINRHSRTTEENCFPRGPCRGIVREHRGVPRLAVVEYNGVQRSTTENENENWTCPSDLWGV
jgi:hypothetical protein